MTNAALHMLDFADEDERNAFGTLPGYDEVIEVPHHLEPARQDDDETLPTQTHPSYPYGRPKYSSTTGLGAGLAGGIGGGRGGGARGLMSLWSSREVGLGFGGKHSTILHSTWPELALLSSADPTTGEFISGILEQESSKEMPPQMAGAKRPPSPPSPSLFAHINHPLPIPVLPSPSPSLSSPPHSPNSLPAYPDASFDYPEGLDEMEVDEDEDRLAAERMEEQWRVEERVEEESRTRRPRRAAAVAAEAGMRSM